MEIKWFNAKDKEGVASFYLTNIDLNIVASVPFQYAYRVQIGVDDKRNIVIKPYNKARVDSGELDEYALYKLSINKSYTRISSTDLMKNIANCLGVTLDKKVPTKFKTKWNDDENILIVLTGKEN